MLNSEALLCPSILVYANNTTRVVSDLPAVRRIALEALEDMRRHNVRYAELRTTPRQLPDGTSRREYVEAVLQVFREFEDAQACCLSGSSDVGCEGERLPTLIPRLLLSVNRARTSEEAMEIAALATQLRGEEQWKPYVVGMDFSGNPTKGSFEDFRSEWRVYGEAGNGGGEGRARCAPLLSVSKARDVNS